MTPLPKNPFENIAISLSGGGYRAAAFHLGTLTYLSSVKWKQKSLLERVRILSTVSGGTLTGVKYATTIKKSGTIKDCYKDMYQFMSSKDLIGEALKYLSQDSNWGLARQRSLISSIASIYHKEFESEKLGKLWEDAPPIHLKEISFNATEFDFAIPFRFQKTEKAKDWDGNYSYGFIGNNKIRLPLEYAKELRLADIIAASSCFPLGFEPINFPDDFIHDENPVLIEKSQLPTQTYDGDAIAYPVGLMDGGIDDNQGIDSVTWAEERMRNYPPEIKDFGSNDVRAVDLYIISDVASPYIENFIRTEKVKIPGIGNFKFGTFKVIGWILVIIALIFGALFVLAKCKIIIIVSTFFFTLTILGSILAFYFSDALDLITKKVGVPTFFITKVNHFKTLNFNTIAALVTNRVNSAKIMVSDVFMKQIRRFSYSRVYNDQLWMPRLVMNAVYELCETDVKKRAQKQPTLSDSLKNPGEMIMMVSEKAKNMSTTLWFTSEDLKGEENMLNTLIACGQYTVCFNLIEYIEKWLKNPKFKNDFAAYSPELQSEIDALYDLLTKDWMKFQANPYWMVAQCNYSWLKKIE